MSSQDTKIKRTFLESGLGFLAKQYEKNPIYGHMRIILDCRVGTLHDILHVFKTTLRGGHFMTYYTNGKCYGHTRTVPFKCKLTVTRNSNDSTRTSILETRILRVLSLESSRSSFESS